MAAISFCGVDNYVRIDAITEFRATIIIYKTNWRDFCMNGNAALNITHETRMFIRIGFQ